MKSIIIPPDVVVFLPCLCDKCGFETDHICEFVSVHFIHHAVAYRLVCETCLSVHKVRQVKEFWATTEDWKDMMSDISEDVN